jgi:hypothetical protein
MSANRSSTLFRRTSFSKHQPSFERAVAIFLLLLSWFGTLLWSGGGWAAWSVLRPYLPGLGLGVMIQIICTAVQWIYGDRWGSAWYLAAVAASSGTTVAGYFPLLVLALPAFGLADHTGAWWGLLVLTIVAGLLIDIFPERILIAD